ncbi:hypothetical protein D3C76_1346600 [compost metagenome]
MGRAAAEGNHTIAALALQLRQALLDVGDAGVGFGAVENRRVDVAHRQQFGNALGDPGLGQTGVGDDQRLAQSVAGDGGHRFVEAVDAHDVDGGDEERAAHGETLVQYSIAFRIRLYAPLRVDLGQALFSRGTTGRPGCRFHPSSDSPWHRGPQANRPAPLQAPPAPRTPGLQPHRGCGSGTG